MESQVSALQLQLSKLENENDEIRRERDEFRAELSKFRKANGILESDNLDLKVENGDLRRKLLRIETLPAPQQDDGRDKTPSIEEYDMIEVNESSDVEEPVSPLPEIPVPLRPITTPTPQDTISLPTSSSRGSAPSPSPVRNSGRTKLRCLPMSPSSDAAKNKKRGIEQLHCLPITKPNKKQKLTKGQSDECNGVPSGPKLTTGSPILAVDNTPNNVVTTSSSVVVGGTLARLSKKRANIVVTIKPEALRLPDAIVSKDLKGCARLSINPTPKKFLVSRQFIGETYGGSQFTLLATSTDKSRNFIFPTPDINPDMPVIPGEPGLLLSCRREMTQVICTLFSRNETKPARWEYIGEYESQILRQLSALEFTQQTRAMKNAWAKKIIKSKKWPVYTGIRARIFLRKDGQALTDENIEAEILRITSKATQGGDLSTSDVIKALESGEELLDIVRMTCVSYDNRFLKDMVSRSRSWIPTSGKSTSKHKAGKGKKKTIQMDSESSDSES